MKRSRINPIRRTLRRGEPTPAEREAARIACFMRAQGRCEIPFAHKCPRFVPLDGDEWTRGQLAHLKAKRRFGWFESEETGQRHLWSCREGHWISHVYGAKGEKPCPPKERA